MTREPQVEAQLGAMAGAADRANRPRMIVIVCLLLACAALVLVLAMTFRFTSARSLLADRLTEAAGVERYAELSEELGEQELDLAEVFPDFPSIADVMAQLADGVTGTQSAGKITVGQAQYKNISPVYSVDPRVQEVNVRCTYQGVRATDLFAWMEAVQATPELKGTFVTALDIQSRGEIGRWIGSVQFRRYVYRETAR